MTPEQLQALKESVDTLTKKFEDFLDVYYRAEFIDKTIHSKKVYFNDEVYINAKVYYKDGLIISTGSTTGLKIGNATTEKIGLYGVTPVVQASAIAAPSTPSALYDQAEAQSAVNAINSIRTAIKNIGITA